MARRLTTAMYTRPGAYIGQIIEPKAGTLTADARVTNYIGKGSKYAVSNNSGIRRSFVYGEEMTVPTSAPFVHTLSFAADGVKDSPSMVYNSVTGQELLASDWKFEKVGSEFRTVVINPDVFDSTAVYKIDYQSTSRDVKDPLPIKELRFIKAMGNNQDRAQYKDLDSFFIPYDFTGPFGNDVNAIPENMVTGVTADVNNFSSGGNVETLDGYDHDYNRFYELEVVSNNGVLAPYTAEFKWSAKRYSGGKLSAAPTPLHSSLASPTFNADETDLNSLTADLELGIKVKISFGPQNFQVGDKFYFNAVGAGKLEFNSRYTNSNQYVSYSVIDAAPQVGSTGSFTFADTNNFNADANMTYKMICTSVAGSTPNRVANFVHANYGELIGTSGTVVVNEGGTAVVLPNGVRLNADFGALNFVAGDEFTFEAKAPRMFYQAKDDREIRIDIASVIITGADEATINMSYATGTAEGGFGTVASEMNLLTGSNAKHGLIKLPDNVTMYVRNMIRGNINESSYAQGDKFTSSVTSTEVIDWSLTALSEELRETTA